MSLHDLALDQHSLALAAQLPGGEGWRQASYLALALVLSALIGLEREVRQKSAGLRTHTLVGIGAATFTLVSKYGFTDVLETGLVRLDPSRVAAQIVTGIGFIGAGLIFVRQDSVRGLTTAASIWVTAAIGSAAGAGLWLLAVLTTVAYFVVSLVFHPLSQRLPLSLTSDSMLRVTYPDGLGVLRELLSLVTSGGFVVSRLSTEAVGRRATRRSEEDAGTTPLVEVTLHVHGKGSLNDLAARLSELDGVHAVVADDSNVVRE